MLSPPRSIRHARTVATPSPAPTASTSTSAINGLRPGTNSCNVSVSTPIAALKSKAEETRIRPVHTIAQQRTPKPQRCPSLSARKRGVNGLRISSFWTLGISVAQKISPSDRAATAQASVSRGGETAPGRAWIEADLAANAIAITSRVVTAFVKRASCGQRRATRQPARSCLPSVRCRPRPDSFRTGPRSFRELSCRGCADDGRHPEECTWIRFR